jgi:trans-AT polyketide synthase/acyltransferase/oxidoreductase domain-containing protein
MTTLLFPGQGAQQKGMGSDLFSEFPEHIEVASQMLGRSLKELIMEDPNGDLKKTQFTQPALFTIGALSFLKWSKTASQEPAWLIGHSLGEFTALFAGGAFDFETGLKLVIKRGALMASQGNGAMSAVIGLDEQTIRSILQAGHDRLDLANINTPSQIVLAGTADDLKAAEPVLLAAGAQTVIPLNVSAAFHSRAMRSMQADFVRFMETLTINDPRIPVVSNYTARPHERGAVRANLAEQLCQSVRWVESIRWIWGQGGQEFIEMLPGRVLTGLVTKIQASSTPLVQAAYAPTQAISTPDVYSQIPSDQSAHTEPLVAHEAAILSPTTGQPGSRVFRETFGVRQNLVAGGLGFGVASTRFVQRLSDSGFLAFLGADGLSDEVVSHMVTQLRASSTGKTFGVNVRGHAGDDDALQSRVLLMLSLGVNCLELSGCSQVLPALIRYRLQAVARDECGVVYSANRLMIKVTRPDVARLFLSPAPAEMIQALVQSGSLSEYQAELSRELPMVDAVTACGDGGGDTDGGTFLALLPIVLSLRNQIAPGVSIGVAGGIGTPEAACAAFMMGADYIQLGSVLQCSVEAAISDVAKDMLARMDIQDSELAPSEDWFDWGGKVRVLKKGSLFAARAAKLYDVYRFYDSWEAVPQSERERIEQKYLCASFDAIAREMTQRGVVPRNCSPKLLLARVFCHYLSSARQSALDGDRARSADFQIWTGPALGAFNQWVASSDMQDWRNRHVDQIANQLIDQTLICMRQAASRTLEG